MPLKTETLADKGEFKGELGDLFHTGSLTRRQTLTISDRGIGMTAEELDKYINQIALSSANEFLEKYKDSANAIIGHFGPLYSTLWLPKSRDHYQVYKEDAPAVKWSRRYT